MANVVPAAPGTRALVSPTTGPCVSGGRPGRRMPVPMTRLTFSSRVIAATTSLRGALAELRKALGVCQ